ncbi:hypothetical protein GIB67_011060 [Kingdonia uniflora]|uniref:F-box domain-containing protein n=1 Tax=Kingdonia uniflora TaxID=39325 RepID=A0A7J7L6L5_9MAGN|nr:hypothetical protein GIB67_011060 [Kingdonia uniflora]
MKRQRILEGRDLSMEDDRISILPDAVIHSILELLPTKCAVSTSELSKRWRYMWTSISNYDFTEGFSLEINPERTTTLMNLVDRVLFFRDMTTIKKFSVGVLGVFEESRVNAWVSTITMRKVQELFLAIYLLEQPYVFPESIFSCKSLTSLRLESNHCILKLPIHMHLPNLKNVHLKDITFPNDSSVLKFVSSCPTLEELILYECKVMNMKTFCISSPMLKTLTIFFGEEDGDDLSTCEIEISAPNLIELDLISYALKDYSLSSFSSLVDAQIMIYSSDVNEALYNCVSKLLPSLLNVEVLKLSSDIILGNLLDAMVDATELLEDKEFWKEMEVGDCGILDATTTSSFLCLKKVEFIEFGSCKTELPLLIFFLKNARVLESLSIDFAPIDWMLRRKKLGQESVNSEVPRENSYSSEFSRENSEDVGPDNSLRFHIS